MQTMDAKTTVNMARKKSDLNKETIKKLEAYFKKRDNTQQRNTEPRKHS